VAVTGGVSNMSSVGSVSSVGNVGLACKNEGHKFLARFEAVGIAARRS